jgi:hypothetical protein
MTKIERDQRLFERQEEKSTMHMMKRAKHALITVQVWLALLDVWVWRQRYFYRTRRARRMDKK